ncbi:MAG: hypothetical protein RMJ43_03290 [Chloroherpetonaceae bacterium]|nr:hypothetical protein [Chloroherpetonaceae bacterium]
MATGVAMTTFLADALLNHVLRNTPFTSPTNIFIGLFTSNPGESGGGTEVSGGGYARQQVTFGAPQDNAPDGRRCTNSSAVTFPQATANWGTITHAGLFSTATGGNMLFYGALSSSATINAGDTLTFAAGNISVGMD